MQDMYLKDGRNFLYVGDVGRKLVINLPNLNIIRVCYETKEGFTKDVKVENLGEVLYADIPDLFLSGEYSALTCYAIATDGEYAYTASEAHFEIKDRQKSEGYSPTDQQLITWDYIETKALEYMNQTEVYMGQAGDSADNAESSAEFALQSKNASAQSEANAKLSETNAKASETAAKQSETNARASEVAAKQSEDNAQASADNAESSAESALQSKNASAQSEANAKLSETNAKASETAAEQTLAEAQQIVAGKADKTYVDSNLATKADKSELAVERARIDSLSTLPEGSTTGDAELIGIRIGADGVTYPNAGEAVRTQILNEKTSRETAVNELKGDLVDISEIKPVFNMVNIDTSVSGLLNDSGTVSLNGTYKTTDFIYVDGDTYYTVSSTTLNRAIAFYDENKNFLKTQDYYSRTFKTIKDARYVRLSYNTNNNNVQMEIGMVESPYHVYSEKNYISNDGFKDRTIDISKTSFWKNYPGGKNLFDVIESEKGYSIGSDGKPVSNPHFSISNYIDITYKQSIVFSGTLYNPNDVYIIDIIAFYDDSNELVYLYNASSNPTVRVFQCPLNATKFRFSYRTLNTNMQVEYGEKETSYEEFIPIKKIDKNYLGILKDVFIPYYENPWFGKRLVVDGDSITHDQGRLDYWQFVVADILGMKIPITGGDYANGWRGVGGSRIANDPYANTDDPMYSIVLRYQNYPSDADIVVIAGGTNDWAHGNVDLGDFDSTDVHTFNGALNVLLKGLKEKYPTIPIVMMTPIKRGAYGEIAYSTHGYSYTQEQFVDAMIKKCRQYNVYCIDMWANCPINPNIESMRNTLYNRDADLVHPNTKGQEVMGKTVAGFIRTLN